jgi:hypothetical protein
MNRHAHAALWMLTSAVGLAACGNDSGEPDGSTAVSQDGAMVDAGDAGEACVPPAECQDFQLLGMTTRACCSRSEACGYELPPLDDELKMSFENIESFYNELTSGGRCAPLSFFFGPNPPLPEARVTFEGEEDILLTPDCGSYHVLAWGLPGCCLADDTCGLSTNESWSTFANIIQGDGVPFDRPQCLSAETLNRQFRDSVALAAFARTVASGTCDHAALDARLEHASDPVP